MNLLETIPEPYRQRLDHPVAIFGTGTSGRAIGDLLAKIGVDHVFYDERNRETEAVRSIFTGTEASGHRLVVHSPAFTKDHPWIETARHADCLVVSEMDLAQQLRTGHTIAVTGTNGKTTLQEFITFSLKRSGVSAVAAGQNQYPLSRLALHPELDGVTAVCEIGAPHAAVLQAFECDALFWTNFHEDHLDDPVERKAVFEGMLHLLRLSPKGKLYLGKSVFDAAREFGCDLPGNVRELEAADSPDWELPDSSAFATNIHKPALALFRRYWLDCGYADSLLKSAAENFDVRAHRLHVLTAIGKSVFWNDSHSGNFAAVEAALSNFSEPVIWIGGGNYRGGDLDRFAAALEPSLKAAVLTGSVRPELLDSVSGRGIRCEEGLNLRQAVEKAYELSEGEHPVVFSPGFPAGDEFGDFIERGICYENAVLGLKHQIGNV